jgi:hypothetical protein
MATVRRNRLPPDKGGEGAGLQAAKRVEITFLENDFL